MRPGTSVIPPQVVNALNKLTASAVRLAVALGMFMDPAGRCYPGCRTLMRTAGIVDWRTFKAARKQLAGMAGLAWKAGAGSRPTVYQWPVASVAVTDKNNGEAPAAITDTGVCNACTPASVAITDETPYQQLPSNDKAHAHTREAEERERREAYDKVGVSWNMDTGEVTRRDGRN